MKTLDELNEAVTKVLEIANSINQEVNEEIFTKAPLIIHQRFCARLVEVMKNHPNKAAIEIPGAIDVLTAIEILEELYPELKK